MAVRPESDRQFVPVFALVREQRVRSPGPEVHALPYQECTGMPISPNKVLPGTPPSLGTNLRKAHWQPTA